MSNFPQPGNAHLPPEAAIRILISLAGISLIQVVSRTYSHKCALEDGLAEAGRTLEVGVHGGFQFLHYAQAALHFGHDPRLLS